MITRRDFAAAATLLGASATVSVGATVARQLRREVPVGRDHLLTALPMKTDAWTFSPARNDMIDPIVTGTAFSTALEIYDRIVARDYVSPALPTIMLNIAYKRAVRQEERFHWPELCYSAQGFHVSRLPSLSVAAGAIQVGTARFLAQRQERIELVHYVIRVGELTPVGSLAIRRIIFRDNLALHTPDGSLSRMSLMLQGNDRAAITQGTATLTRFFQSLYRDLDRPVQMLIA